jgi:hypothetical protein
MTQEEKKVSQSNGMREDDCASSTHSLELLEQLAKAKGELPLRTSPSELDALGLEGKDCPCAPR